VVKDMDEIKVELSDRTRLEAIVVGMDEKSDVALLKLPVRKDGGKYPSASFADSDSLKIGEMVLAIGNPFQFRNTITMGIVSATGRTEGASADAYADYIQTDAAVNPGNSGGPLVNLRGQVVGINSSIWTRSGGYQGISFAIPINQARRIAEDLAYDGEVSRGWLGVSIEDLDSELAEALGIDGRNGAKIVQVNPQTPAEKAGLKAGDVVLAIDGHVVSGSADLRNRVAALRPNQKVNFRLQRDGKELVLPVVVGRLKGEVTSQGDGEETPSGVRQDADGSYTLKNLGLRLSVLNDKARERGQVGKEIQGVAVSVMPDSPASDKAIPEGAVLVAWKGPQAGAFQPVKDLAAVVAELRRIPSGSAVALMFQKGEQKRLVGIKSTGP
jgi:serine protease Do